MILNSLRKNLKIALNNCTGGCITGKLFYYFCALWGGLERDFEGIEYFQTVTSLKADAQDAVSQTSAAVVIF